jgi:hypothetical protein
MTAEVNGVCPPRIMCVFSMPWLPEKKESKNVSGEKCKTNDMKVTRAPNW